MIYDVGSGRRYFTHSRIYSSGLVDLSARAGTYVMHRGREMAVVHFSVLRRLGGCPWSLMRASFVTPRTIRRRSDEGGGKKRRKERGNRKNGEGNIGRYPDRRAGNFKQPTTERNRLPPSVRLIGPLFQPVDRDNDISVHRIRYRFAELVRPRTRLTKLISIKTESDNEAARQWRKRALTVYVPAGLSNFHIPMSAKRFA